MSLTERLKHRARKLSETFLRPRNPDSLTLENLFFDPNISLPSTGPSTTNSSFGSSCDSASRRAYQLPEITTTTEYHVSVDEARGITPPVPAYYPSRLRHRRRDTSPSRRPPACFGGSFARSATDPSSIDCEQSFLPPVLERDVSNRQLKRPRHSAAPQHPQNKGLIVSNPAIGSEPSLCSSKRERSFQSQRLLQTSPARIGQGLVRDIGGSGRKSASVSKSFHSEHIDETRHISPTPFPQQNKSPVEKQDPSRNYPRLLASSIFDGTTASSLYSQRQKRTTQVTQDQSMNLSVPPSMATMRASAFLDPNSARSSRLPESQIFTRNEAKKQEAVIHAKLKSAGEPIPPYEFLNFIGKGSYGRVYLARDLRNDRRVALKISDIDAADYKVDPSLRTANLESVMHEYTVLKQLEGAERVNQILDILDVHSQVWIASEYCPGGSVHTLMQAMNGKVEEKYIKAIARELAKGLKAVHDADIIHRDIKAANVMILENGGLQIIDFGIAGILETKSDRRDTIIGTPHWMGPELLRMFSQPDGKKQHGKEVDVWSYGCTIFEMATGYPPNGRIPTAHLDKYLHRMGPPKLKVEDGFSQELSDFLAFTMELEPEKRPTMDAILEHPYIRDTENDYPTSSLIDLIKAFEDWAYKGNQRSSLISPYGAEAAEFHVETATKTEWRFSTLESTEIFENLSPDSSFDFSDTGYNATAASTSHLSSMHIDPIADISSAQAQEDTMNSYFEGEPPDGYLDEDLADEIYKPLSSPQPHVDANFAPDEASVQRGANHLGSLFGRNVYNFETSDNRPQSSDLPLRGQNTGATRQDTDGSTGGSSKSGRNLANIDTLRANSYNARPPTMNFGWEFPAKATTGVNNHGEEHPNLRTWTTDGELDYGTPSDDFESSYDEEPNMPPTRPALRHASTEPIPLNESAAMGSTRGSRLDMDALMGTLSVSSGLYAAPVREHYSQTLQPQASIPEAGSYDESIDLDAMMNGYDGPPTGESYADPGDTPRDQQHTAHLPPEHYDTSEGHLGVVPTPQPPSEDAMRANAPQLVLEMEVGRFAEAFRSGLGILSQQFGALLEEDGGAGSAPLPTNGEEKVAPVGVE